MSKVVVVDYDPLWPSRFEAIRAFVWPAVEDVAMTIEHVGSTAVPGLAAKPVIDLDIVAAEQHVTSVISRLEQIGYRHRGDLGIPGREAFSTPLGLPKHHLYVCPEGSEAHANHLAVRDALRKDPIAAQEYSALKKQLALQHVGDIDRYIQGKTSFIVTVLRKAGFDEDSLAAIERRNGQDT